MHTSFSDSNLCEFQQTPSARVGAASALLDRGWGRAHQSIDASISNHQLELDSESLGSISELLKLVKSQNTPESAGAKRSSDMSELLAKLSKLSEQAGISDCAVIPPTGSH